MYSVSVRTTQLQGGDGRGFVKFGTFHRREQAKQQARNERKNQQQNVLHRRENREKFVWDQIVINFQEYPQPLMEGELM